MNKLISVIIPVYNVQDYLNKCIDSVIAQSYKNLQIILINDGSTDNSLSILNKYLKIDNRIEVHSKTNGGLSDARNFGLNYAKGEYVSFVDSDDVLDINMLEILIKSICENNCDIAVCNYYFVKNNKQFCKSASDTSFVLDSNQALDMLYDSNKFGNFAWNKLYKINLFDDIRFPVGKKYEDIWIMHELYAKSNNIVFIDKPLYYYYFRNQSIVAEESIDSYFEYFYALINRAKSPVSQTRMNFLSKNFLNRIIKSQKFIYNKKLNSKKRAKLKEICEYCYTKFSLLEYLSDSDKKRLLLCIKHPKLYSMIYKVRQKVRVSKNPLFKLVSNFYINKKA